MKTKNSPDFLLEKNGEQISIEATTCNPTMPGNDLKSNVTINEKIENEYRIKFLRCIEKKVEKIILKKNYTKSKKYLDKLLISEKETLAYEKMLNLLNGNYEDVDDVSEGELENIDDTNIEN